MAGIDTVQGAHAAQNLLPETEQVKAARGTYQGETVMIDPDLCSQLEDLVEEIGMAVAYRGDRRLIEKRKVRHGSSELDEADNARLARYRRALPDLPGAEALQLLFENVRSLDQAASGDERGSDGGTGLRDRIMAELEAYDADVTNQFVALELAIQHLADKDVSPPLNDALREVQARFAEGDLRRDVRAGFAAALPALEASPSLGVEPGIIRSTYRMMLADARNMAELFGLLRGFDLKARFTDVVATFTKAAARDLASTGPSTDRGYLRALLAELNRLAKAKSVVLMAADLMKLTNRHLPKGEKPSGNETDVAGNVLRFACNAAPAPEDAQELLAPYRHTPLSAQLVFANGLRELHGDLPADVAPSPQAHLMQNEAIMEMLETLVEAEENEYQSS
jgi:hypothetical protein